MATMFVAGEELQLAFDLEAQLHEIGRQIHQKSGYPFDARALRTHLQQAIEGAFAPSKFGKLEYVQPVEKGKVLGGHDFVKESRRLANEAKVETLGDEAYDFYKKKENQHLLPGKETGINVVVFVEAQVASGGSRSVRYLCRDGAGWDEDYIWLGYDFGDSCAAAVSQVGPKISES